MKAKCYCTAMVENFRSEPSLKKVLRPLRYHGLTANFTKLTADAGGRSVTLSLPEYRVLTVLIEAAGRIATDKQILDRLYANGPKPESKTVPHYILRLRRKLEVLSHRFQIERVENSGYKLNVDMPRIEDLWK